MLHRQHTDVGPAPIAGPAAMSPAAAIAELGQAALIGLDIPALFEVALELLAKVLDLEVSAIFRSDGPTLPAVLQAGRGWEQDTVAHWTSVPSNPGSWAAFTLETGTPVIMPNLRAEARFAVPDLLIDHGATSGISVTIPTRRGSYGLLAGFTREPRRFAVDDTDLLRSVAMIVGGAVQNARSRELIESQSNVAARRVRFHNALAACAQTLLASSGDRRLEEALEELLGATQATYVFVERNVDHPDHGFCSQTVAEVESDPSADDRASQYWDVVPWSRMPISRSHLERGEHIVITPEELEGPEAELYANDPYPVKSELDIPIFVDGVWAGLIGFADSAVARDWTPEDLSLLTTAAKMIGAFWERDVARQHLEHLVHTKDEFLATVSHELRTPLTAVLGFGELLRDAGDLLTDDERAELLDSVVSQSLDLTNIVSDLLVAARDNIETLHVDCGPVAIRGEVDRAFQALELDGVTELDIEGADVVAHADADRVRQIIRNLLSNAVRYGGESIRVELRHRDHWTETIVADSGSPIDSEDVGRIFQPYQRAHDAPGVPGSLGLGLPISRRLAELMGGTLEYRHAGGESQFVLRLPAARSHP